MVAFVNPLGKPVGPVGAPAVPIVDEPATAGGMMTVPVPPEPTEVEPPLPVDVPPPLPCLEAEPRPAVSVPVSLPLHAAEKAAPSKLTRVRPKRTVKELW